MIIIYTIFLYFFSLYVIKKSIFFFNKYSIIDLPTDRSNHKHPTPKCAGLIIIPTVVISTIIFLKKKPIMNGYQYCFYVFFSE